MHLKTLHVTDLDGTLLLPDGTLGRRTLEVVNAFIASGGLITYATGRSYYSASRALEGLNLHLPVITYVGAVLVDPLSGVAEAAEMIPSSVVETVLELITDFGLQPILFLIHEGKDRVCWLEGPLSTGVSFFLGRCGDDPRLMPVSNWKEIDTSAVFYVSVIADAAELDTLHKSLSVAVRESCHVVFVEDIYAPGYHWLEFTSSIGTKAHAVEKVLSLSGAESLVCFGDSLNDLPMFAIANEAYAVANSAPEVKSQATAIIGSNSDEAVATWLESQFNSLLLPPENFPQRNEGKHGGERSQREPQPRPLIAFDSGNDGHYKRG